MTSWRRTRSPSARPARSLGWAACGLVAAACSGSPASTPQSAPNATPSLDADIVVDPDGAAIAFDRRLLGTNVPAWLGPDRLNDTAFQAAAVASGTTLVRMPGGSWSNSYDWHACETGDNTGCNWPAAARPTDFIDFLQATELEGMWTVSINASAEAAAAAVAFFNGRLDDDTEIGIDRYGEDWATVGDWAQLRADHGNPDPIGIALWEIGNEVYGGRPDSGGDQCASFGWEEVWTCDGSEYVRGDRDHDGYLAISAAMRAVDPGIEVGAVGVGDPGGWNNWGNEVIAEAGDQLDFYVVHQYGFDQSPDPAEAVDRPLVLWPQLMSDVTAALGTDIPVAVTEYNLVSVRDNDTKLTMTQAMNALYIADSIGQLATHGVTIANQWNLANGLATNGTDYGLIDADDYSRYPQFEALSSWSAVGSDMLPTMVDDDRLRVYATRHDSGARTGDWTLLVINLRDSDVTRTLTFAGGIDGGVATLRSVWANDLTDTVLRTNPPVDVAFTNDVASLQLPPWSITTIEVPGDE